MKESELLRLNDYLALRVMELEADLELEKKHRQTPIVVSNTKQAEGSVNSDVNQMINEHRNELTRVNLKYRTVTENYAKLKEDYEKLQARYADLDNVKGLRRLAYAYARRGFLGLFKRRKNG